MSIFKKGRLEVKKSPISVLQMSALSTVGYLIGKKHGGYINDILEWYSVFKTASDNDTIYTLYNEGMERLAGLITDDPFLSLQVKNALSLFELDFTIPSPDVDLGKYQVAVDAFITGVYAAQRV